MARPTITIADPRKPGDYLIIDAAAFDPRLHRRFDAAAPAAAPAPAAPAPAPAPAPSPDAARPANLLTAYDVPVATPAARPKRRR